jgi:predicted DNA-binding protein
MEGKMGSQIVVKIDEEKKEKFQRLVRMEGKSASGKIREMVEDYIEKTDVSYVIDNLWARIGLKITDRGFREGDIEKMIKDVQASQ